MHWLLSAKNSTTYINNNTVLRAMRTYQSIWITLKKDNNCKIAVHPALHARVIKAVIKEKDMDVGYKLTTPDVNESAKMKLSYIREGSMIKFFLRRVYILKRVSRKDL